jgi:hypothetical protein
VLSDSTGCVDASFFGTDDVRKNDSLLLKNVEAKVIKEHIQIQKGKYGKIYQTETEVRKTNTTLDISRKAYVIAE